MPLSPPPFQSLYLLALSDAPAPLFFPLLPPTTPSVLPARNLQALHREVPQASPHYCHLHHSHLVLLFCWRPAFMGSVRADVDARRSAYLLLTYPRLPRASFTPPPQHISYLLSTRCLKIQTPLNFCQCLHVLSVGRGVKGFVGGPSEVISLLSSFYALLQVFGFFFLHFVFSLKCKSLRLIHADHAENSTFR